MGVPVKTSEAVAESLADSEYSRQRLAPHPKDEAYVHLSDIRIFLEAYEKQSFDKLLDYGCGGSPYRALFNAKKYIRADYVDCGNLDCLISQDGRVPMPDGSCDAVLSTQVLEHVFSPGIYLTEAFRLLRPGGKIILTTHGVWEEHGCPYDFRRWTCDGLRREMEDAGFQVTKAARLTTGPRAIIFLFCQMLGQVHLPRNNVAGLAFRMLRRSSFGISEWRNKWMDRQYADHRVVYESKPGHGHYLALGIEAVKPESKKAS